MTTQLNSVNCGTARLSNLRVDKDIYINRVVSSTGTLVIEDTTISGIAAPIEADQVANKEYVDNVVNNVHWKPPVKYATIPSEVIVIGNTSTPASGTIDGVNITTLAEDTRVLIKNQNLISPYGSITNGIYVVTITDAIKYLVRSDDMATGSHGSGTAVIVEEGSTNADKMFICSTNPPTDIVGTNVLVFAAFSGGGGGSPGGNTGEIQFNSSGSFEGSQSLKYDAANLTVTFGGGSSNTNVTLTTAEVDGVGPNTNGVSLKLFTGNVTGSGTLWGGRIYANTSNITGDVAYSGGISLVAGNSNATVGYAQSGGISLVGGHSNSSIHNYVYNSGGNILVQGGNCTGGSGGGVQIKGGISNTTDPLASGGTVLVRPGNGVNGAKGGSFIVEPGYGVDGGNGGDFIIRNGYASGTPTGNQGRVLIGTTDGSGEAYFMWPVYSASPPANGAALRYNGSGAGTRANPYQLHWSV